MHGYMWRLIGPVVGDRGACSAGDLLMAFARLHSELMSKHVYITGW